MTDIKRLKKRKKELHLTFDQLAEKSGIAKNTLYDIFRGITQNPRIDTMQALEQALELNDKIEENQNELTSDEIELLEMYRRIPEENRKFVFGMLRDSIKSPLTKQKKEAK